MGAGKQIPDAWTPSKPIVWVNSRKSLLHLTNFCGKVFLPSNFDYQFMNKFAKVVVNFYIVSIAILLTSCVSPPISTPPWIGKYKNACLPEAIAMSAGLQAHGIQSRVLRIQTRKWSHAVCVYMFPTGQNKMWVWDSHWKSVNVRAWYNQPDSIARAWLDKTSFEPLVVAEFLD